jgi:hypothetical protein
MDRKGLLGWWPPSRLQSQAVGCHARSPAERRHRETPSLANKSPLEIGEPHIVRPAVGVQSNVMATMAIDQDATQTHFAHLADLSGRRQSVWGGMPRSKRRRAHLANYRSLVVLNARELLPVVGVDLSSRVTSNTCFLCSSTPAASATTGRY